ncbi:hypothetical protein IW139_000881 [Coemansia sp. RSA 353]|nr:hypothetical protein LPJ58_003842 [Coemansia sp. RSA 1591]KAJ1785455.1 hypothetical protein LPJ62_004218 [Coemansia sp. RSA 2167]KAJ2139120.1 hypothetical protein GGH17_000733 [Coemansia sp. RSA 788]KAJ2142704.1 hypothetical protein IW142_004151 [Coemansia sp. RSA 564]KAJ2167871.1 hypothetical protein GGH15_001824 [Coemansia sp. RSA 562]KAJ2172962.1 hypothetical protein GGH16_002077 [Coemansia sp. RSA 560]KAJ2190459.1 hypothetical protein EV181_001015 [Coemansia sp. RSA 532]KAJ2198980.1 h
MALFDEKDESLVKTFLFNKIERECDADPAIMADYILVTLQNDMPASDLKQHCKTDLTEFFGDSTNVFVDTLFEALGRKEYLPVKETNGREDARDIINKARRRSRSPGYERRQRSRSPGYERSRDRSRERERRAPREQVDSALLDGPLEQSRQQHSQQQQFMAQQQLMAQQQFMGQQQPFMGQQPMGQQQRRRRPCFEFLRKGSCQRGDTCTYAHVTAEQAQMMGMQVPPNMRGDNAPNAGFNPHMRPQQFGQQQFGREANYSSTAVYVTNIPDTSLDETHVREFFGRFGAVQNVRIDYNKHAATVEYGDANAQSQALSTPEAVFNNRFVRVLRAVASNGAPTQQAQQPQAVPQQQQQQHLQQQAPAWRPKSAAIKKAEMIEKYVEQQKELMKKLTTTKDMPAATRKIIMDSIKQIQQQIDASKQPKAAPVEAEPKSEPLDAVASEKAALQDKLKTLQAEAARLGMNARGRGRGRGQVPRGAMSLDKRPRTLVLRNVGQDAAEQLQSEMAQFGDVENIDKLEEGSAPFTYAVKFKARWEAERALKAVETLDVLAGVSADWEQ